MNPTDLSSWRTTAIILGIISVVLFAVQRSTYMFMDPIFEVCIFHVPAILAVGIYLYYRRKEPTPTPAVVAA